MYINREFQKQQSANGNSFRRYAEFRRTLFIQKPLRVCSRATKLLAGHAPINSNSARYMMIPLYLKTSRAGQPGVSPSEQPEFIEPVVLSSDQQRQQPAFGLLPNHTEGFNETDGLSGSTPFRPCLSIPGIQVDGGSYHAHEHSVRDARGVRGSRRGLGAQGEKRLLPCRMVGDCCTAVRETRALALSLSMKTYLPYHAQSTQSHNYMARSLIVS